MKKNILVLIMFISVLFAVSGQNFDLYPVYDESDILTEYQEEQLNSKIKNITDVHGNNLGIYILIVDSYSDYAYSLADFGEAVYKAYNLGMGTENDGILMLLSMDEREYDITAYGYFGNQSYTDFGKKKLGEVAVKQFKNDDWYKGLQAFVDKTEYFLCLSEKGKPFDEGTMYFDSKTLFISLGIAFAISFIVGLIVSLVLRGKMNNVKLAKNATTYVDQSSVKIFVRSDDFKYVTETRTPINQNNSGGNGHSGGTSVNSRGFSHSGGHF